MGKNKTKGLIILAVVLVIFGVIAFAIPFIRTACFWLGFAFGIIAILYQPYVYKVAFSGAEDAKSKFYGFPIARVGTIYLIVQLIVSIIEMALAGILPAWVAVVINIILLGFAIIGCIAAESARDEIARQDAVIKKAVTNMRELQSLSSSMAGQCSEEQAKEALKQLAEAFRYSDPVSGDATIEMEGELLGMLKDTQKAMIDGDYEAVKQMKEKIGAQLEERNRVCKLNK